MTDSIKVKMKGITIKEDEYTVKFEIKCDSLDDAIEIGKKIENNLINSLTGQTVL
ncbi:hypothetical protein GF312_22235 [Candidatus Poribacteria bacterium]|nr:hypothetical protein [Candidatus Poribacteria bacterium]